jgi:hypothetical protein
MRYLVILTLLFSLSSCTRTEKASDEKYLEEELITEPITSYNLRKSLIDAQDLEAWPTIIEIKQLSNNDSLVLYLIEESSNEPLDKLYLRGVITSDLKDFSEAKYSDDCRQAGTTLTELRIGELDGSTLELDIFCKSKLYAILEQNKKR